MNRVLSLFSVAALCACGAPSQTALRPAASADTSPFLPAAAEARAASVHIVARSDAWTGDPNVLEHVTPLRVRIQNDGEKPIQIRYRSFYLTAHDGDHYAALPPFEIEGDIEEPVDFEASWYDGFQVAPYQSDLYPGVGVFDDEPFGADTGYDDTYATAWTILELPTRHMQEVALAEGALSPGGRAEGFLYFQHVPADEGRVELRAEIVSTRNEQLGTVTIPFRTIRN